MNVFWLSIVHALLLITFNILVHILDSYGSINLNIMDSFSGLCQFKNNLHSCSCFSVCIKGRYLDAEITSSWHFCRANVMNTYIVLITIAAVLETEACFGPPGGGGGSETTTMASTTAKATTAKATTTTAKATTTTTKAPDCPMENKNCLASDASNMVEIKTVDSAGLCSKQLDLQSI